MNLGSSTRSSPRKRAPTSSFSKDESEIKKTKTDSEGSTSQDQYYSLADPKTDVGFKYLFKRNTQILKDFLKDVLKEEVTNVEITDPEVLPRNELGKRVYMDLVCHLRNKEWLSLRCKSSISTISRNESYFTLLTRMLRN